MKTRPAEAWAAYGVGGQGRGVDSRHLPQRPHPGCRRESLPKGLRGQTGHPDVGTRTAGKAAAGRSRGEPRLRQEDGIQSLTLGWGRSWNLRSFGFLSSGSASPFGPS